MVKIVVDCFGGDRSPGVNIDGAISALKENEELYLYLVGDEAIIKEELAKYEYDKNRIEIVHAPDVIDCNEVPTVAIKKKTESSIVKSYELLKNNEDVKGLVTLGSTGAVITGAVLKLGRIKGVKRPGLCPVMPTMDGNIVCICDSGANAECDPIYLQQFGIMGNIYLQKGYGIENPRVALLNVGTEEEKGDTLHKEAYQLLKGTEGLNFVGNMESRDLISGNYDLVVCDGFSGNVALKSTEGTALELLKLLKQKFTKNLKSKMGALLLKSSVYEIKDMMDYNNYPGAILLGCSKVVVKGHGSSKARMVKESILLAYRLEKNKMTESISEYFRIEREKEEASAEN